MPITRRTVLRDAALLSFGTASSSIPLSFLAGCKGNAARAKLPAAQAAACTAATQGIRIFFSGSWLFSSAGGGNMFAISLDLPGVPHRFLYGKWATGFDKATSPVLSPNPAPVGSAPSAPYNVTVTGHTPQASVDILFLEAQTRNYFTYLQNATFSGKNDFRINYSAPAIRIVQIPIPTRITPASYLSQASLAPANGVPVSTGKPTASSATPGIASAHIFEYNGPNVAFNFGGDSLNSSNVANAAADYHFHTIPNLSTVYDHAPCMFANLLSLLTRQSVAFDPTQLQLQNPAPAALARGSNDVPGYLTDEELGLPSTVPVPTCPDYSKAGSESNLLMSMSLASCAGGGAGLGGDGGGN